MPEGNESLPQGVDSGLGIKFPRNGNDWGRISLVMNTHREPADGKGGKNLNKSVTDTLISGNVGAEERGLWFSEEMKGFRRVLPVYCALSKDAMECFKRILHGFWTCMCAQAIRDRSTDCPWLLVGTRLEWFA